MQKAYGDDYLARSSSSGLNDLIGKDVVVQKEIIRAELAGKIGEIYRKNLKIL